jgi:hypothetical protein
MHPDLAALLNAFQANLAFNVAILAALALGVVAGLVQAARLRPARRWIDQTNRGFATKEPPRLVAPLARVFSGQEREGVTLSTLAMHSLLEGVRRRLQEARYLPGCLALLPLVMGVLEPRSALLALGAALALGVVYLLLRAAQNRFLGELEEFLASRAELPSKLLGGEGTLPAYLEALLKQIAENLGEVQRLMARGEEERRATQGALTSLSERLAQLSDQLRAEQKVILTLARHHADLQPAIAELSTQTSGALAGSDEIRSHLRNIDLSLARLLDEAGFMREQVPQALRQEVRLLAETMR